MRKADLKKPPNLDYPFVRKLENERVIFFSIFSVRVESSGNQMQNYNTFLASLKA